MPIFTCNHDSEKKIEVRCVKTNAGLMDLMKCSMLNLEFLLVN